MRFGFFQKKQRSNKFKWYPWFLFGIGVFILFVPFTFYALWFGPSISKDHMVWGEFGNFMSLFVSITNLFIIATLTMFIAKNEESRDEEMRKIENSKIRPIVIFKDIGKKWACRNIGEGAAMNIMIAYKTGNGRSWENPVKIYSLVPQEVFEIEWRKYGVYQWVAVYYDIRGTVYTSICENDDTDFQIGKNELTSFLKDYKRLEEVESTTFDDIQGSEALHNKSIKNHAELTIRFYLQELQT